MPCLQPVQDPGAPSLCTAPSPVPMGEKYDTYPALRLIQVLPGHPLADPKR